VQFKAQILSIDRSDSGSNDVEPAARTEDEPTEEEPETGVSTSNCVCVWLFGISVLLVCICHH